MSDRWQVASRGTCCRGNWCLVLVMIAIPAYGQTLRPPDFGVWLSALRGADGSQKLIVNDLAEESVFALAGVREGDHIISINGQPATSEGAFVQALMSLAAGRRPIQLVVERNGPQHRLALDPSALVEGIATPEPLFQAGLIIDERYATMLIVQRVFRCTPAFYAGLRQADVITKVNGQPMESLSALTQALAKGGNLSLEAKRNDQPRQMIMSLAGQFSARSANLRSPRNHLPIGQSTAGGLLAPGAAQPPPAAMPLRGGLGSPPLLAPPIAPSNPPVIPTAPPIVPQLPPAGAVRNVPGV